MTIRVPALTERNITRILESIRALAAGRSNASGRVRLVAGTTETIVPSRNVARDSSVFLTSTVASDDLFIMSVDHGTFTIGHPSMQANRMVHWVALG